MPEPTTASFSTAAAITSAAMTSNQMPTSSQMPQPSKTTGWEAFGIFCIILITCTAFISAIVCLFLLYRRKRRQNMRDIETSSQINLIPYQTLESSL